MTRPGHSTDCEFCRPRPPPTSHGEGSGLIDIRTMGSALASSPLRPKTPLPGLHSLAPAAAAPVRPRRVVRSSQTPLHVLLGVLVFGMVGLAGAVVHSATRTAPTRVIVEQVTSEPTRAAPEAADEADEPDEASAPDEASEPAAEPTAEPTSKPTDAPRRPRTPPRKPELDRPAAKPAAVVAPSKPEKEDPTSVACLLDPGSCATKREAPPTVAAPPRSAGSDLPAKLEPADISDGTRAAKAAAMSRCAKLARGGEVVKIKLSITGPSGAVLSAGAEADGGNAALASCAAGELEAAQFKPVQKQQIGAVVTLKF